MMSHKRGQTQSADGLTPYRINTMTVTGCISCGVNLPDLYNGIDIIRDDTSTGVVYTEFGKNKSEMVFRGFSKKAVVKKRVTTAGKRFDNQVTIVYKLDTGHTINIKTFRNGNVQMTGVKFEQQGIDMIEVLILLIVKIQSTKGLNIVADVTCLKNVNYKVCMMNSNFVLGFPVRREELYDFIRLSLRHWVSFESCIYSGVKILYFFNDNQAPVKTGVCQCLRKCYEGKGNGEGESMCKKVTIAVFQSGAVIITGAQSSAQLDEVYAFISGFMVANRTAYERVFPAGWKELI